MKKRLFSFLMSGCMLFSFMLAASAMAVSNDKVENISTPEKMAQIINRDVHQSGNNLGRGEKKSQLESIVIAKTQVAPENTYGAVDVFYYEYGGYYVLKYEDSQQAKEAAAFLKKDFPQSVIFQDKVVHQETTDNFLGDIRGNILQKSKTEKEEKDTKAEPSAKQEGASSEEETEKAATDTDDQATPDENSGEDAQDSAESSDENQQGTEVSGEEEEVLPEWLQELANLLKPTKGDPKKYFLVDDRAKNVKIKASIVKPGDGKLEFRTNYPEDIKLTKDGRFTPRKVGKIKVYAVATRTKTFDRTVSSAIIVDVVKHMAPLKKLSVKALKKGKVRVKFQKAPHAKGYEIQYSAKKSRGFKNIKTTTSAKPLVLQSKKLKKGKTYYLRARAYKVVKGKKFYGKYTPVKKVKIRR